MNESTVLGAPQSLQTTVSTPVTVQPVVTVGVLLLIASVTLNVLLAYRLHSFTQDQSVKLSARLLTVGTTVPPIIGKQVDGRQARISYQATNQSTVLYVFTPPCLWCARNMDNFKALAGKESTAYHFIGISLSDQGLAEYVAKNDLKLPVYSGLSPEALKTYKLGSTPQTIVISPEGKVLQDWVGAYVGDQQSQVEAFFHVKLPGLRPVPTPTSASRAESSTKTADQRSN
jgi:peroxiredoxin